MRNPFEGASLDAGFEMRQTELNERRDVWKGTAEAHSVLGLLRAKIKLLEGELREMVETRQRRDSLEWCPQGIVLRRLWNPDALTPLRNLEHLIRRTKDLDPRLDDVLLGRRPERFYPGEGFWWRHQDRHPARRG